MDKIFIKGLKAQAIVGVHDWERQLPRPLLFDLELGVDIRPPAAIRCATPSITALSPKPSYA